MKKTIRRLSLNRETVRTLTTRDLGTVAGGTLVSNGDATCGIDNSKALSLISCVEKGCRTTPSHCPC